MLKLISGVAMSIALVFTPAISMNLQGEAPSENVTVAPAQPQCVPGSELQSRFLAEKMKEAKQVWVVAPSGIEKLNKHFNVNADWAILVYFGGLKLGYGLWSCGQPLPGLSKVVSYSEMSDLMNAAGVTQDDATMVSNQGP